ncbi:M48 family metallopeptidase [Mesorhizobium sp. AD1-1]|uniref:M48 family metallopeptidase n=1 Tax=Mesorhizobium sp. AD1-1 TaxID=2876621 RepID=UPI001CC935B0|nr:M48 family metallopeptidase [Mesorhizobium sp. AD1-1]MBZ9719965.1 M48 family metallopeptidase [Mesorhizobium sp. AD1-1]
MSRLILYSGTRFGRFAILLFALPLFCPVLLWLVLLDRHPLAVIAGGIVAIPAAMLAFVLLIGMLFAGFRRSKVEGMSRNSAPQLWAVWESIAGKHRASRTTIVLSDSLNASIGEERPFLGLLGRRAVLTVGIPLLAVTDDKAFAAILAHEDAHLKNKDTNGGPNLAELDKSFDLIFDYAPPGKTVSGSLFYMLLGPLSQSLEREEIRLSRRAEIDADLHAAKSGDSHEAARALLLIAAADAFFNDRVYTPLKRELLGMMVPPHPPLQRVLMAANELLSHPILQEYAQKAWDAPDDEKADHPPWSERLAALGYNSAPTIEPVSISALSSLLSSEIVVERVHHFDSEWTSKIAAYLDR